MEYVVKNGAIYRHGETHQYQGQYNPKLRRHILLDNALVDILLIAIRIFFFPPYFAVKDEWLHLLTLHVYKPDRPCK